MRKIEFTNKWEDDFSFNNPKKVTTFSTHSIRVKLDNKTIAFAEERYDTFRRSIQQMKLDIITLIDKQLCQNLLREQVQLIIDMTKSLDFSKSWELTYVFDLDQTQDQRATNFIKKLKKERIDNDN